MVTRATVAIMLFTSSAVLAAPDAREVFKNLGIQFRLVEGGTSYQLDVPIAKKGELVMVNHQNSQMTKLLIYDRPLIEVLRALQAKEGAIMVDCSLFAQIAAQILGGHAHDPKFVLIPPGEAGLTTTSEIVGAKFGYVTAADSGTFRDLQNSSFISKGQWVVQSGPDEFVGLTDRGIVTAPKSVWIALTKQGFVSEIRRPPPAIKDCPQDFAALRDNAVRLHFAQGKLNEWTMFLPGTK